jgi:hypothetical protein
MLAEDGVYVAFWEVEAEGSKGDFKFMEVDVAVFV